MKNGWKRPTVNNPIVINYPFLQVCNPIELWLLSFTVYSTFSSRGHISPCLQGHSQPIMKPMSCAFGLICKVLHHSADRLRCTCMMTLLPWQIFESCSCLMLFYRFLRDTFLYIPELSTRLLSHREWLQQGCTLRGTKHKLAIMQGSQTSLSLYPQCWKSVVLFILSYRRLD